MIHHHLSGTAEAIIFRHLIRKDFQNSTPKGVKRGTNGKNYLAEITEAIRMKY